jgi:uncharacterized protein (TIGR00369 family)
MSAPVPPVPPPPPLTEAQVREVIASIPYARTLGVEAELRGDELTLSLPYKEILIGNPMLPALHGGVVGAFMEFAAVAQIAVAQRFVRLPKTIDIGIDFLRSGRPTATYARARVTKLGRRIANVRVEAWQYERGDPIATLHGHFLVAGGEDDDG